MALVPDSLLVSAAQAGSTDAFEALVHRYHDRVVRLAYRVSLDEHEAHDIAQDAFLRAFRHLGELESGRLFAGWIFLIARNAAIDSLRRQKRSATLLSETPWPPHDHVNPEDLVLRNDEASLVRTAIASLPERYRAVIVLFYFRDMRYSDIADALDMPIGTVKTFLSRARTYLRNDLAAA